MQLLWAIDHGLGSISKQMLRRIGITAPQRLVLRLVGRSPHIMPSQLAEQLHLDRGTMTGILERLVAQDLIIRQPHPGDRRKALLRLSAKGRRLDRETSGTVEQCVSRALASVSSAKVRAARAVLEAVASEMDLVAKEDWD
jgi:MarR family transcriptional regulator, organic hydroperoxide resistance regulator